MPSVPARASAYADRRTDVLQAALSTFARFGYRKTSMEQVAAAADISRPGLYFLFSSKQALFGEAVERSLQEDLAAAEQSLNGSSGPLQRRLLDAFDHWTGRYLGPLTRDVATVIEANPDMLGPVATSAPKRFAEMIVVAISSELDPTTADRVAQTLISTSIGIKHQVADRRRYLQQLAVAIDLLVGNYITTTGKVPAEAAHDQSEKGSEQSLCTEAAQHDRSKTEPRRRTAPYAD